MQLDANALKKSPLWDHLTDIVAVLLQEKPEAPLELFERLSHYVRDGSLVPGPSKAPHKSREPKAKSALNLSEQSDLTWAKQFINQVAPPKKEKKVNDEGEEEEAGEEEEEDKGFLPDILAEAETFKWCGVGLQETEVFRIMVALKRLLDQKPLANIRFWGKIYGLQKDYYVCEGEIDAERVNEPEGEEAAEEEEEGGPKPTAIYDQLNTYKAKPPPVIAPEARGTGTNKFVYYVATSVDLTVWAELPDVRPEWILAARRICKFFTGDLEAPVTAHPPFPGVEKHFLRAQIARITHGTVIAPRLIFSLTEPPEEEEEDEEGGPKKPKPYTVAAPEEIPEIQATEAPDPEDEEAVKFKTWTEGYMDDALMKLENWVHIQPALTQSQGRASLFKPEEEEEEAGEEEEEVEKPPPPPPEQINPRLSDLAHDAKLRFACHSRNIFSSWSVRKAFHIPSSTNRIYRASSLLWPGAHTFASCVDGKVGAVYANIYIGHAVKRDKRAKTFAPQLPTNPMAEFAMQQDGILQVDATPDDELEFSKPVVPPPAEAAEGEDEGEEEEED
jgi:radial spoke head protein 4A|mmetsp:Transcript_44378/g.74689  ORF Transcript_44378/g.74689 Transcript_44378/m.74689 type:complete len:559 (+) Transcript_44378:89-1765(+)|eukprot:CAMPEP_0174288076 /NCGR_PEP_ID=MMETSP0809-20121228/19000_1 /TAXON_ID=73025 ORGANISM="Eutreptiella gymnastica-like, Strain CCMP1594" /NCGR_SAMPLE_ID=MMETSP0809 /ASSEMBLY_ACC=CAM_ASM_000658 /LENGTH=558 /DNA_ID=CAMNT_0015385005 /DNA_START=89 /DNA_END=1765 /DNA_ORIENTATION=+